MATTASASHAERNYHDTNAVYTLPNDTPEHQRLEAQAARLSELMNHRIIHAPLSAPSVHKALDIGCGTGTVTHDIASQFPGAQVYGLDLSPVPNVREKLNNIEYVQADFNKLTDAKSPDARFRPGTFDYVFSRLLILGMTDWKGYVQRCAALVKPGAWIEMHDIDMRLYRIPRPMTSADRAMLNPHTLTLAELQDNSHPTEAWREQSAWMTTLNRLCDAKGLDGKCGSHLLGVFVGAGLEDVRIKRYIYAYSMSDGYTDVEKKFAQHHREGMGRHLPDLIKKMGQGQDAVSQEDVEKAIEDAKKENEKENWETGGRFVYMYVVCGRKSMSS